ncbi:MAG TPA: YebC/PmpR family DNA-binding transcriptional regulator [Candidatus Saccharibacteria bacterium]|nr:YebC/PmpR family DNA-binding transcriptional regulator [Candidatus Saccharibacteria bacterium]
MSGHSKWSTIKREKGAKDAKRGAIFTKIGNQIAIAARNGIDPSMNSTLAMAIEKAKAVNMPATNIQRAIDRVADKNAAILEEITYEGIGPSGIGIMIETATDNKNRTLPEVKNALSKNGGRLADTGSVAFQFTKKGVIRVAETDENALLVVLDAGANDAIEEDGELIVYTNQKDLSKVREMIINNGLTINSAELQYVPNSIIEISDSSTAEKIIRLLESIDDLDDVVNVYSNVDITVDL